MTDAIISVVVERVTAIIEEQIRNEINLVRGVDKEILNLSHELKKIRNVLDDAEERGFKEKSIKDWLQRLEYMSYEMDDVLDEWEIEILKLKMERNDKSNDAAFVASPPKQKVCSFIPSSCLCFKKVVVCRDIAKKIQNVKAQLDLILGEKDQYSFDESQPTEVSREFWRIQSTSLIDLAKVHGRDVDASILVEKLMANGGREEELDIKILPIVGVAGLGKTTLAQLVYNDSRVEEYFELRIWICVSDPFDVAGIAKGIIEGVGKRSTPSDMSQLDVLFKCVKESISSKRFLLVLDDVWTEDYTKWEPLKDSLKYGREGSKILVTTRNENVARMMGARESEIYSLGQLSDEDCWLLLRRMALSSRNEEGIEFQDIGKEIAKKCKGFPLAAKTLGSLLRSKNSLEEWDDVLNSEIWQLEKADVKLFRHLLLSYSELSPQLKRCFSYCALFPKDFEIDVEKLIENWVALGYIGSVNDIKLKWRDVELKGREYFNILAMRSLFQNFEKSDVDGQILRCKMHDIVHDFTQFLRKNGRVGDLGMTKTCQVCDPLYVSSVKEYRSMIWDKESPPIFCDCLTSLRVLGIRNCILSSIPQGMENLIHLRRLYLSSCNLSRVDLKIICQLYNLQFLWLDDCSLGKIPGEIDNLVHLRHLNLSRNYKLKELPETIYGLSELRNLNIEECRELDRLSEGIHRLVKLKHLYNVHSDRALQQLPQGLGQLTSLRTLTGFKGGSGCSKFGLLKNLNHLSGSLSLIIVLSNGLNNDVVENAREADLRKKKNIQYLEIKVEDARGKKEESSVRMDVIDALEPHPNLRKLTIMDYKGFQLPAWITSPLNNLRTVCLIGCQHMSLLPPLGKLPCLEEIVIKTMSELQFVGREFLGITTITTTTVEGGGGDMDIQSSSNTNIVAFPKLKTLTFYLCTEWKKWEDITAEEEESAAVSIMPCLTELTIYDCEGLMALPHCLLRKASSLAKLGIYCSTQLQRYQDRNGSAWKSISRNHPGLQLN